MKSGLSLVYQRVDAVSYATDAPGSAINSVLEGIFAYAKVALSGLGRPDQFLYPCKRKLTT